MIFLNFSAWIYGSQLPVKSVLVQFVLCTVSLFAAGEAKGEQVRFPVLGPLAQDAGAYYVLTFTFVGKEIPYLQTKADLTLVSWGTESLFIADSDCFTRLRYLLTADRAFDWDSQIPQGEPQQFAWSPKGPIAFPKFQNSDGKTFREQLRICCPLPHCLGRLQIAEKSANAEAIVGDAIRSFEPFVDLLILIDTGITDATAEICAREMDGRILVESYKWDNDFAAARNFSLEVATRIGAQWALTTDTDERFEFGGFASVDNLLNRLSDSPSTSVWMVEDRDGSYSKERLFRLPSRLTWVGKVHEAVVGYGEMGEHRQVIEGMCFWEESKSPEQMATKLRRDRIILEGECAESPKDPRNWYYLGQTFQNLGEPSPAIEAFLKCVDLDGWPPESASACLRAGLCFKQLGKLRAAEEMLGLAAICA